MKQPTIILIADYGTGDPAFTEVTLTLQSLIPSATILPQSVPPFSTVNTGYWIAQFALTNNLTDTYIYSNTAPRKEAKEAQKNNKGEKLMYAKLKNGFEVIAVNAGYVFSFVRDAIDQFHFVNVANEGSQFRSRDIFPKAVAAMIQKKSDFLGEKAPLSLIPEAPESVIASVDGYGNLKTSIRQSKITFKPGQQIVIQIQGQKHTGMYSDGIFNITDGDLVFAPGSTGHQDKFMEISVRGGSAYRLFDTPRVEEHISILPTS
jgi:S-adenosylmethionine hydrolase